MTKEDALKKIKYALALSESNNINEAQSAMLFAQKLMVKYCISESDLSEHEEKQAMKKIRTISIVQDKARLMWYEKQLAQVIATNFKVVCYSSGSRTASKKINYMGLEEDVEIAQEVFAFAFNRMTTFADNEVKRIESKERSYKSSFKNDFYRGFIDGLDKAFKQQVETNDWGLVLVLDSLVVKEREKLNLVTKKPTGIPPKFSNDKSLYNEGYRHGNDFGTAFNNGNSLDGEIDDDVDY